jgi:hypothetical protein
MTRAAAQGVNRHPKSGLAVSTEDLSRISRRPFVRHQPHPYTPGGARSGIRTLDSHAPARTERLDGAPGSARRRLRVARPTEALRALAPAKTMVVFDQIGAIAHKGPRRTSPRGEGGRQGDGYACARARSDGLAMADRLRGRSDHPVHCRWIGRCRACDASDRVDDGAIDDVCGSCGRR